MQQHHIGKFDVGAIERVPDRFVVVIVHAATEGDLGAGREKHHGRGIGKALMAAVGEMAAERDVAVLTVPSSVTAEPFHAKSGFTSVRDSYYGEERTLMMERRLPGARKARGAVDLRLTENR